MTFSWKLLETFCYDSAALGLDLSSTEQISSLYSNIVPSRMCHSSTEGNQKQPVIGNEIPIVSKVTSLAVCPQNFDASWGIQLFGMSFWFISPHQHPRQSFHSSWMALGPMESDHSFSGLCSGLKSQGLYPTTHIWPVLPRRTLSDTQTRVVHKEKAQQLSKDSSKQSIHSQRSTTTAWKTEPRARTVQWFV